MDAMKEALKRKIEEHMKAQQAGGNDMGHADDMMLADEAEGNEELERGEHNADRAPALEAVKGGMDADRAEMSMGDSPGDADHMAIVQAIMDGESSHDKGSLRSRAAAGAKEKMKKS